MWKTAIVVLLAVWFASPCDAGGPDEYRILRERAGSPLPSPVDRPLRLALGRLGIHEFAEPPGLLDPLLEWLGWSSARNRQPWDTPIPTAIFRLPGDRILVFSTNKMVKMPGTGKLAFHVVSPASRVTRTGPFPSGYEVGNLLPALSEDGTILSVRPGIAIGGHGRRHHYALRGDRFVLVRLTDWISGEIRKNDYSSRGWTIGPEPPDLDAAGWRERLQSEDRTDLLEALVWIGGEHHDANARSREAWHEDPARARVWEEVVTDERTQARLRELGRSGDPWIAEAARCAMEPARTGR